MSVLIWGICKVLCSLRVVDLAILQHLFFTYSPELWIEATKISSSRSFFASAPDDEEQQNTCYFSQKPFSTLQTEPNSNIARS